MSGCCIHCAQPDINCVGVFGLKRTVDGQEERGFGIKIGGGAQFRAEAGQATAVFLKPEQVWPVVEAASILFRDNGYRLKRNNARFKFLIEDWWKLGGGENGGGEYLAEKVEELLPFKLERHHDSRSSRIRRRTTSASTRRSRRASTGWACASPAARLRHKALGHISRLAAKYARPARIKSA
ncbi:MAG: hypothetical protein WDN28_16645 [Chthoniobacter sp.]